jgi:predicted nucleic acid-binding protein
MRYLLDTNVISELQKSKCNPAVRTCIEKIPLDKLYLSVISIGEIFYGIEKMTDGKKKNELASWLNNQLPENFGDRILPVNIDITLEWGRLRARHRKTLPIVDSFIAATALVHHLTLVTRNTKDFEELSGLTLLNPWDFR